MITLSPEPSNPHVQSKRPAKHLEGEAPILVEVADVEAPAVAGAEELVVEAKMAEEEEAQEMTLKEYHLMCGLNSHLRPGG